ncbi:MAG: hypothetical protein H6757_06300 [Candidatus Omnitrophica bacterium]|nr:hypothetical protein [Candidatus Omnitrophota bacterium]
MKRRIWVFILGIMTYSLIAQADIPENFREIKGVPQVKSEVWPGHVERYELSAEEGQSASLWILKKGGEIYWASKEYEPLAYVPAGLYDNFVSYTGKGFVKINIDKGKCEYMETLQEKFGSITYYGDCTIST